MSGYGDFIRLRLAKAATALLGQAPGTGHPVARRFLNYSIPDPERSTAAVRQIRRDAAVLPTMPGWLAGGYPGAVPVALNAGKEHRLRLRVLDEIPRLAAFAALPIVVILPLRQILVTRAGGLMQITKFRTITVQNPDADWTISPYQGTRRTACRARLISMICPSPQHDRGVDVARRAAL
jgi:hypothetical protein